MLFGVGGLGVVWVDTAIHPFHFVGVVCLVVLLRGVVWVDHAIQPRQFVGVCLVLFGLLRVCSTLLFIGVWWEFRWIEYHHVWAKKKGPCVSNWK